MLNYVLLFQLVILKINGDSKDIYNVTKYFYLK